MSEFKKRVDQFRRDELNRLIAQLLEPQREMLLGRLYPDGIPDGKIEQAADLCERTLRKNVKLGRT